MSLPSRERGLKLEYDNNKYLVDVVAPLAGAWIEIGKTMLLWHQKLVAPLAGAWIEMQRITVQRASIWSLPSRERGLK